MAEARKYKTIVAPSTAEFRDRGSRFLAFAYPVQQPDEIKTIHKSLKAAHPKAAHHCVAYRLGHHGTQCRASDDGEPSGSAGKPMLNAINSVGITNVLVVVVRYFGGTLLGVPGLIQAYGSVAAAAFSTATISEQWVEDQIVVECDYANLGEVLRLLRRNEARIGQQDLQLFCTVHAGIPLHLADSCLESLSDLRGVSARRSG